MRMIGLLGGMSFEGSATYYRLINEGVRAKLGGLNSADLILWSVNLNTIAQWQQIDRCGEAVQRLGNAAKGFDRAGAEHILICADNKCSNPTECKASFLP